MAISFEALDRAHDRSRFSSGQPDLDAWFRHRAGQDQRRNVARVFVANDTDLGVIGVYSLGAFTLQLDDLPPGLAHALPRYDAIPAAMIGRLARDERVRGAGVGDLLLADAISRILDVSATLAVFAILVDAKDTRAARFYDGFGFRPFPDRPARMFLLTSTAREADLPAR